MRSDGGVGGCESVSGADEDLREDHEIGGFLVYALVILVGLYLRAAIFYAIPMIDGLIDDTMEVKLDRTNPLIVADCAVDRMPRQG
jgi:hypothetical protein